MTRIAFLDVDGTIIEHGTAIADSTITGVIAFGTTWRRRMRNRETPSAVDAIT